MLLVNKIVSLSKSFIRLSRTFLSISVGFSGWVSYLKFNGEITAESLWIFIGIILLASGASSLNQFQERRYDARMTRTMRRPIPTGMISGIVAIIISFLLMVPGLFLLYYFGNSRSLAVGLFSILWYNLLYTFLKRKTSYALFPGVLTGVGPIWIGWLAAGGSWTDVDCILLSAFMCAWQIPHFLLLLLHYQEDYKKAGFPVLTDRYSVSTLRNVIIGAMIFITITVGLFIYAGVILSTLVQVISIIISFLILILLVIGLKGKDVKINRKMMIILNSYMLMIMILLLVESLT